MLNLRKIISFILLALCLQWIVPHELVHSFCDHTDTIDQVNLTGNLAVGQHHEHCLILELTIPPLWHHNSLISFIPVEQNYFYKNFIGFISPRISLKLNKGRGPPNFTC